MILQKMPHYVDSILTQEDASAALQDGQVVVGLYTNRENVQSVVHSHPYYEMILPVAGSSVRYSVDGSVYDLHLGELILFPGEMYHSGKFNISDTTSERLVVQIAPVIWERAWAQSGLPRHVWSGDPVILDTDAVTQWDFRGLLERMEQQANEMKQLRQALDKFKAEASMGEAKQFLASAKTVKGLHVLTTTRDGMDAAAMRTMGDFLRDKDPSVVAVIASTSGEKVTFLAVCGKEAVARGVKAGELIRAVCAVCGGKGGGKPDSAMGGGNDPLKVDDALATVDDFVSGKLG